ncbi:hypothetical protein LCGC14_1880810 [marine sediment metagenome]|uniref:Uncharacterized protein n=1 Tax=marine sediment metagenome TaxID=412755 RepID=A0A0F9IGD2_9ZZZZ
MASEKGVFRRRPDYFLVMRRPRRMPITITAPPVVAAVEKMIFRSRYVLDYEVITGTVKLPAVF